MGILNYISSKKKQKEELIQDIANQQMLRERKAFVVFIFSAIGLGIMTITAFTSTVIISSWVVIIVGLVFMLLAIPMHILARKQSNLYLLSFLFNSIGTGFSVSTYYAANHQTIELFQMLFAVLLAMTISFFTHAYLNKYPMHKKRVIIIVTILILVLCTIDIFFWINTHLTAFSFGFFSLLFTLFYTAVFGITINKDRPVLRDISFGSFGSFIILTVVIVGILTDGVLIDGFDIGGDGKKKERK